MKNKKHMVECVGSAILDWVYHCFIFFLYTTVWYLVWYLLLYVIVSIVLGYCVVLTTICNSYCVVLCGT